MKIITAVFNGKRITRKAFSDFQAWIIINTLSREGCTDIAMREEEQMQIKSRIMEQLQEARFPVTDLRQGAERDSSQQTDDVVLYERAVEIVEQSIISEVVVKGGDAYAQGKTYL